GGSGRPTGFIQPDSLFPEVEPDGTRPAKPQPARSDARVQRALVECTNQSHGPMGVFAWLEFPLQLGRRSIRDGAHVGTRPVAPTVARGRSLLVLRPGAAPGAALRSRETCAELPFRRRGSHGDAYSACGGGTASPSGTPARR